MEGHMENVLLEIKEGIAFITINRPKQLNALNKQTLSELDAAIEQIKQDESVRVAILTGAGEKSFVAGADIGEMYPLNVEEGIAWGDDGNDIMRKLELLDIPTIAAVNGYALGGGCELALACDIRVASSKARFGQPEAGLGITPGFGGTQRLPRLIGPGKAKELIFTCDIVKADEAKAIGLVNHVVEPEELMDFAVGIAQKIMKNAKPAVKFCKRAIDEGAQTDLDSGLRIESKAFGACFATTEQKEAMHAFLNRSKK
jgi:enoyl-CoA hydratase